MKTKKLLFFLVFIYGAFQVDFSYAQQTGLVLVNKDKPKKKWQINKGQPIKISHFSNGHLLLTNGILEGSTADTINLSRMDKVPGYYSRISNYQQQNFTPQIAINNIQYLKPKRSAGKDFMSLIGYLIAVPALGITVGSFSNKPSFIFEPKLSVGLIGLSIGGGMIWLSRKRKYKISNGPWVINK